MTNYSVEVVHRESNAFAVAELHSGLRLADLLLVERAWSPERARLLAALLKAGIPRTHWPQSLHWDWSTKAPELALLQATGYGVACGGEWQGLMMTKTVECVAKLRDDSGKPLVYIDFLEAAPWNWRIEALGSFPRYKAVGSVLFRQAILQSFDEGFHGRVGLHSLSQAEGFYEGVCGMTRVGEDAQKQGLVYYEFSRAQAQRFISEGDNP